jgi:hypothetical protein
VPTFIHVHLTPYSLHPTHHPTRRQLRKSCWSAGPNVCVRDAIPNVRRAPRQQLSMWYLGGRQSPRRGEFPASCLGPGLPGTLISSHAVVDVVPYFLLFFYRHLTLLVDMTKRGRSMQRPSESTSCSRKWQAPKNTTTRTISPSNTSHFTQRLLFHALRRGIPTGPCLHQTAFGSRG